MTGSKGPERPGRPEPKPAKGSTRAAPSEGSASRPTTAPAAGGSLYEQYKDALRRGHVAALRGRHDAALGAYGEAASIAPDRALPHASIGGILAKMNRPADAVAAYRRALALAPRDETALRGIAEVLARLGRRTEAASALDRLADGLDAAGRVADAADTARRALELAESRPRRRQVESLVQRLRDLPPGDEAVERTIAQAVRVLDAAPASGRRGRPDPAEPSGADDDSSDQPGAVDAGEASADAGLGEAAEPAAEPDLGAGEPEPEVVEADHDAVEAEPAAAEPAAEEVVEPAGLGIALGAAAEAQLHAGDLGAAREGLLAAARAHRRAGRLVAAVDACDLAIGIAPADPDLHLLLAELYLDRGWRTLASDKLLLLGRIAMLDEDVATRERLCAIVSARLSDDPRLTELCA